MCGRRNDSPRGDEPSHLRDEMSGREEIVGEDEKKRRGGVLLSLLFTVSAQGQRGQFLEGAPKLHRIFARYVQKTNSTMHADGTY